MARAHKLRGELTGSNNLFEVILGHPPGCLTSQGTGCEGPVSIVLQKKSRPVAGSVAKPRHRLNEGTGLRDKRITCRAWCGSEKSVFEDEIRTS